MNPCEEMKADGTPRTLMKEIHYLTNLINAHKARHPLPKPLPKRTNNFPTSKFKPNPPQTSIQSSDKRFSSLKSRTPVHVNKIPQNNGRFYNGANSKSVLSKVSPTKILNYQTLHNSHKEKLALLVKHIEEAKKQKMNGNVQNPVNGNVKDLSSVNANVKEKVAKPTSVTNSCKTKNEPSLSKVNSCPKSSTKRERAILLREIVRTKAALSQKTSILAAQKIRNKVKNQLAALKSRSKSRTPLSRSRYKIDRRVRRTSLTRRLFTSQGDVSFKRTPVRKRTPLKSFVNSHLRLPHLKKKLLIRSKYFNGRVTPKAMLSITRKRAAQRYVWKNTSNIIVIRGNKFHRGSSGRTLTNVHLRKWKSKAATSVQSTPASKLVNRSIRLLSKKKTLKKNNRLCIFYSRFGRCNKGPKCSYVHDPSKVAVCTKFLRGTCKISECPFSHKIEPEKMPACRFFLRGCCSSDNCPYLHAKVSKDAQVCKDFAQGVCLLGQKCKKRHVIVKPEKSIKSGISRKLPPEKAIVSKSTAEIPPEPCGKGKVEVNYEFSAKDELPAFIPLVAKSTNNDVTVKSSCQPLQIRPKFLRR